MLQYKAPVMDMKFLIEDVFKYYKHYESYPEFAEATPDLVDAILQECAKFCENELLPLNQSGDKEGCQFDNGVVTTPTGFKAAYNKYVEGGWQSLSHPVEHGGQGLPPSLGMAKQEMMGTANWSWAMYPGLSHGAMNTIQSHGTQEQKELYLTRLTEGTWTGTMCLTEPQCGTDLGQVKTKAIPNDDGTYDIVGTKIFISAGEHDLTENIIHIVLARLPGAPEGTRGISLFIVPKIQVDQQGNLGEGNQVTCGAIEDKMGIKASSTAVLNFDNAKGVLIGPKNKGLECMFTFMNTARVGTALQGVCASELAYQNSLLYAKDRLSMRALTGKKCPDKVADPIIVHPDVRKMLMTQKAISEGGRAMIYYTAKIVDEIEMAKTEEARKVADDRLGFITPILKAFLTEMGCESTSHGMQVFGGHGYIKEWGMEQIVRDVRISTLYEGTTGIQALDLLGRKILLTRGKSLKAFSKEVLRFCKDKSMISKNPHKRQMNKFIWALSKNTANWQQYTMRLALKAKKDRDIVGSASVDYLMYSGYIMMAYFWAQMAQTAYEKLATDVENRDFYRAKIKTAEFYFERLLPRTKSLAKTMMADPKTLMQLDEDLLSFL
ncbi:MAG: acyl-CoA dehydrogenase [Alteromonadaceae bacterium]|uniref:Acyl-CoA dehydrogenase n=1 Tax=Paraglaciecola agarilytica NO2 TaxID=1125747 RepID=A0ABQ0I9L9_9ALTE|nr:acyl-CoA dehydrogenase C-terminal domain-containing protein [Paraglaciecola agarilytica]MBN27689.1 acyl-CoA dehydrogenase [Alteromonadaceae bacterium]GAC05983.1 acyl-CoA dehydrogenase [Paraglaciecola agarilytica NO2]|tara:strand:+ start:5675 stop:7495 length:1821 start_codon:yes stop_codon:yes gene_type:complete